MILVNLFEPGYKPDVTGWSGLLAISLKLVHQSRLCVSVLGRVVVVQYQAMCYKLSCLGQQRLCGWVLCLKK